MNMSRVTPATVTRTLIKTPDGAELIGTLYSPVGLARAVMVLNSATGVPQGYYAAFARWAAEHRDVVVLTYDYRDTGLSLRGPMRKATADMVDWGVTDAQAVRAAMRRRYPKLPLWVTGHSLGAMLTPMQRDFEGVDRITGVASGIVHTSDHPWPYRFVAISFWHLLGPLSTALMGYLPGRRLRFGEDLPAPAYWQWRRWCTSRDFYADDLGRRLPQPEWGADKPPVRLFAFEDDDLIPPHCVAKLAQGFEGGEVVLHRVDPKARGLNKVGHLGAFSRRNRALWDEILRE